MKSHESKHQLLSWKWLKCIKCFKCCSWKVYKRQKLCEFLEWSQNNLVDNEYFKRFAKHFPSKTVENILNKAIKLGRQSCSVRWPHSNWESTHQLDSKDCFVAYETVQSVKLEHITMLPSRAQPNLRCSSSIVTVTIYVISFLPL